MHFRVCTIHTHTRAHTNKSTGGTGDFIPPQEAGALEVCHRDSSLKLMGGDRWREKERTRDKRTGGRRLVQGGGGGDVGGWTERERRQG